MGQFLAGKRADGPQEALQILDIVLRELSNKRYCPIGRSFFSPDIRTPQWLGERLESWCGFYQSIRPTQIGLSLNIDMASAAFIEPLPVVEFVDQLLGKDVLSRPLSDADRIKINASLALFAYWYNSECCTFPGFTVKSLSWLSFATSFSSIILCCVARISWNMPNLKWNIKNFVDLQLTFNITVGNSFSV